MVLRNLMRQAYDRERKGETLADPGKAPAPAPAAAPAAAKAQATTKAPHPAAPGAKRKPAPSRESEPTLPHPQLENLKQLRDQGILTEEQFQAARKRLLARADA
jgi:hypothetical protein